MLLTKFQIWLLKLIFRSAVVQGYFHQDNIKKIYKLLREAANAEFTEDNDATLNEFMREQFESSQHPLT